MLDGMERRGQCILSRPDGRPWYTKGDDKALSKAFHAHADISGIEGLKFHDLRGTAVVLMCAAGLEIPQVAAITGHTLRSASDILERYGATNKAVARAGIIRLENSPATEFANRLQTKG
jgi:integrase